MAAHEWFRATEWDDAVAAEFERRLKLARPAQHAEYLRIQASQLIASPDASTRQAGRVMLERVIREFPYHYEAKFACEQLGTSFAEEGWLPEAEKAYRHTIVMCKQSSIGYSGGSGVPELFLAEVLLRIGDRAVDAWELLEDVAPRVEAQNLLRGTVFRHRLASARAARDLGLPVAADFARQAIDVAEESEPSLPRHPTLGRVDASTEDLAELRAICG